MEDAPDTFALAFTQGEGVPIAQTRVISARESFIHRLSDDDAKRYSELDSSANIYMPYMCGGVVLLVLLIIIGISNLLGGSMGSLNAMTIGGLCLAAAGLLIWPPFGIHHVNKQLGEIAQRAKDYSYEVAATVSDGNLHLSLVCYGYIEGEHRRVVMHNKTFTIEQQAAAQQQYQTWQAEAAEHNKKQQPPASELAKPWAGIPISHASQDGKTVVIY